MNYALHAAPRSSSFAPHVILEEIGEPFSLALISAVHPGTKTEEFRRLNPKGRISVLTVEKFLPHRGPAIIIHLGLTNLRANLLPANGESITRSVEWLNWPLGTVHAVAVRMVWRPDYFTDDVSEHAQLVVKGKQHLL